jgi:DnaJ-class molecular chaperone
MKKQYYQMKKFRTVMCTCQTCAGRGLVAQGHFTRKRGSRTCDNCNGDGEIATKIVINE